MQSEKGTQPTLVYKVFVYSKDTNELFFFRLYSRNLAPGEIEIPNLDTLSRRLDKKCVHFRWEKFLFSENIFRNKVRDFKTLLSVFYSHQMFHLGGGGNDPLFVGN